MNMLSNKVAIITGAGSGIGRATAQKFAAEGAIVVVSDLSAEGCEETCSTIAKFGKESGWRQVDVSKAQEVEGLVDYVVNRFGRLDCAVNNAGIQGEIVATVDCSESNWDRIIATNLKGVFLCLKFELRQMLKQGSGAIVNIASNFGLVGSAKMPAYSAAKHGVAGLTKTAALEVAQRGIRVNAVCPGPTFTPLSQNALKDDPSLADTAVARLPIARWGTAEEVAEAIAFLCSDAARLMVGAVVPVDGGYVAQ